MFSLSSLPGDIFGYIKSFFAPQDFFSPYEFLAGSKRAYRECNLSKEELKSNAIWRPYFNQYFPGKRRRMDESYLKAFIRETEELLYNTYYLGDWFQYASEAIRSDPIMIKAAVKRNGWALKHAREDYKGVKDIVLAAVKQHGCTLELASDELKRDKEVVLAAVNQCGWALEYADEKLKHDRDVVLAALRQDPKAWQFVPEALQQDAQIRRAFFMINYSSTICFLMSLASVTGGASLLWHQWGEEAPFLNPVATTSVIAGTTGVFASLGFFSEERANDRCLSEIDYRCTFGRLP